VGQPEQLVGLLAHRRHDDDGLVAPAPGARHVVGDLADPLGVAHGRPAELLHDYAHRTMPIREWPMTRPRGGQATGATRTPRQPDPSGLSQSGGNGNSAICGAVMATGSLSARADRQTRTPEAGPRRPFGRP